MNRTARLVCCFVALLALARPTAPSAPSGPQRNEDLLRELQRVHGLSDESMRRIREVFAGSAIIGQGNPAVTEHPVTPEACVAKLREAGISYELPESDRICGARHMAPLYNPSREKPQDARACIDRSVPEYPCAYPSSVGPVRPRAVRGGAALCDPHECEGACAAAEEPDYRFDLARG